MLPAPGFAFRIRIFFLILLMAGFCALPAVSADTGTPAVNMEKETEYAAAVAVKASRSTLKELLQTALRPVGSTMYIWGGGWNRADNGAGTEARFIGLSPRWKQYFRQQSSSYDYRNTRYQIADGLDCSGYVGWVIYNALENVNGRRGYVLKAQKMAQNFAARGWGAYTPAGQVGDLRAGDIMSSPSHVWIVLGECADGSAVLLHSNPPGVRIAGTPARNGKENSQAYRLARLYMKKYYPEWFKKYPECLTSYGYLTDCARMRWDLTGTQVMTDPDGYRSMNAEQILHNLFGKQQR